MKVLRQEAEGHNKNVSRFKEHVTKYLCNDCGWFGYDVLQAPSPFDGDDLMLGCPNCRGHNMSVACDVEGCGNSICCGGTAKFGEYMQVCDKHAYLVGIGSKDAASS